MDTCDAVALASLAFRDRRLAAAVLRSLSGRPTADDQEQLPTRDAGETFTHWLCRCGNPTAAPPVWVRAATGLLQEAGEQLQRAATHGIFPIPLGTPAYPALLAAIDDPPPVLWVRGEAGSWTHPSVAMVGSRAATPYALGMAGRLAMDLASAGLTIVSGLARGVDAAAHAAAVEANGRTVGVLGCGADRIYPAEHDYLARQMLTRGAVVSEFPPGVPPRKHHFPRRNRLISGLSSAVIVVEAPEKSGSLITASAAAEQGRDVMVVPGPATGRNRGGHLLLRDGARPVETADDVLQEFSSLSSEHTRADPRQPELFSDLHEFTVDEEAARSGDAPSVVLARLLSLELAGRVQRVGGGRFVRVLT